MLSRWARIPSAGAFSQSVLLLIYAFTGFEMAAIPAGEIEISKTLPRALLISIACRLYLCFDQGCLHRHVPELATSGKTLAEMLGRDLWARPVDHHLRGRDHSIAGNLNIVLLSGSRVPFAIAEQKQLPSISRDPPTFLYSAILPSWYRRRDAGVNA